MTVQSVQYRNNLVSGGDTTRRPSNNIWAEMNIPRLQESGGMFFHDDFLLTGQIPDATGGSSITNMGPWGLYASQGGLNTDPALEGGVIGLSSDGDQESVTLASLNGAFRLLTTSTLALNQKLAFECRVAFSTITTTKMDSFIGLADTLPTSNLLVNTKPITTTDDALATACSLIGFHKKSGASTEINFAFNLAGGTVNYPTGLTTLMNTCTGAVLVAQSGQTGFVKLGFIFDPLAATAQVSSATARQTNGTVRKKLVRVFVNGIEAPTFLSNDDVANATSGQAFPTGFMGPVISNMQTATGANKLYVDWIRVAQEANS